MVFRSISSGGVIVKLVRNLALGLLVWGLSPGQLEAQSYPLPGSKSEPQVLCTGCGGTNPYGQLNDGLKTYPYGPPLVDHVGRYVDSQVTANFQHIGFRTARARSIRTFPGPNGTAPPRMYIVIGNAVAGYDLNTFFSSKLPAGMVSVGTVKTGAKVGGFGRTPPERILMWDGFVYPEATDSGWYAPLVDQQDPIGGGGPFDLDDRGYLYATYPTFGWGIAKDDGRTSAIHFPKVVQMVEGGSSIDQTKYPNTRESNGVNGSTIVSVRDGSKYYAIVASLTKDHSIFDVTDPTSPRIVATITGSQAAMRRYDRSDAFSRIAWVDGGNKLQIASYAGLAAGSSPMATFNGQFSDVAFDDAGNVWATESSTIWKFTPAGNTYQGTEYAPFGPSFSAIRALAVGAGHVAVAGVDRSDGTRWDVRVAKIEAAGPRLLDLDNFFKNYYHGGIAGHAEPGQYTLPQDLQLVKHNNKTYLMYSALGLGDVFELQGGDSINATMKTTSFGTVNPHSKPAQTGPFPGDTVAFVAVSSNPAVSYDVSWDFGNSESGSANNDLEKSGIEVKHQYTGLNTAAKVTAPKTVRAVAVQDTTIESQIVVNLKLPVARVGVAGLANPITITQTTPLEVVAGASFNDASDGSVEGHYGLWTVDGSPTKLKPNETLPVGAVGEHTLKFEAFYGKYDAAFNSTSPYPAAAITIPYVVKPFRVTMKTPTKLNAATIRFSATPEHHAASFQTVGNWDVTWTLSGGSAAGISTAAVTTQAVSAAVGTIPNFDVPLDDISDGTVVTLGVAVNPLDLITAAQQYPEASASVTLSTPNPAIKIEGCDYAESPCKLTATTSPAGGSTADWTVLWTLKRNGSTAGTSTSNPYSPSITQPGSYTVDLVATKTVFSVEVNSSFTAEQSLCGALPESYNVTIAKIGCATSCAPNTVITFRPSIQGYGLQECDTITWTFGDGGTATGTEVTHAYTSSGTKTVTMKITNTTGSLTKTTTVSISGGTTPPPPPPSGCTMPANITFNWTGCSSGGCRTTDSIKFTATRGSSSLQICDNTLWALGDGTSTVTKSPSKTYATAGTYTVSVVVSNTNGTASAVSKQITITNPSTGGGTCSVAPTIGNFAVTFSGGTSGCSNLNLGKSCDVGEVIGFQSPSYFYTPSTCDQFEWRFGDNSAAKTGRTPTHMYTAPGDYNVELKVTNPLGSSTYTRTVRVAGGVPAKPVPVITPTSFPGTSQKGKPVTFTATSNLANTTGWTWNFGDGSPANSSQAGTVSQTSTITYTFPNAGTFTVKATARNSEDTPTAQTNTAQAVITITEPPANPEFVYLLPVVVHAKGMNGSSWRTDVQIYNPDMTVNPLLMDATFKGTTYPLQMIKATHIYEDFLGALLFHQKQDQGPVIITVKNAKTPPQIWSRTYNQLDTGGTFGQYIPAIRLDDHGDGEELGSGGVVSAGTYYLTGLRHDDRYRTNVGFLNPNAEAITANVKVYDDRRFKLGEFPLTLQPFDLRQFALNQYVASIPAPFSLPPLDPFYLQIEIPDGTWLVAYASLIDGFSNDPVYLPAVRETEVASPDHRQAFIPGVGHTVGASGTGWWQSDVTIFNPDAEGLQFDLLYYNEAGEKKGEALGIQLDGGKFLQYSDILKQGVMGVVDDGKGLLKINVIGEHEKNPIAFSRTYYDDGANGTYGQGIPSFAPNRANVKAGKAAIIAGVRQNAHYRTNVGLVNFSSTSATATVTLLDPVTGAPAGSLEYVLAPNESVLEAFSKFGPLESGTLKITATGDVWAFASIIDERTNDPEYVAATPLQ